MKMKKIALIIGINYKGTNAELKGCINDANYMARELASNFNYNDIRIFTDDTNEKPTRAKIISELEKLIVDSVTCSEIFFHFSGHGGRIRDQNNDEKDGFDEVIFPLDYKISGIIKDDFLHDIIMKTNCDLRIVLDSCNSASAMDLFFSIQVNNNKIAPLSESKKKFLNPRNILMLSGCIDSGYSYDVYDPEREKFMGALTSTFLNIYNDERKKFSIAAAGIKALSTGEPKIESMLINLTNQLREKGYRQVPVLSSNKSINIKGIFLSCNSQYKPNTNNSIQLNVPQKTKTSGCSIG